MRKNINEILSIEEIKKESVSSNFQPCYFSDKNRIAIKYSIFDFCLQGVLSKENWNNMMISMQ